MSLLGGLLKTISMYGPVLLDILCRYINSRYICPRNKSIFRNFIGVPTFGKVAQPVYGSQPWKSF